MSGSGQKTFVSCGKDLDHAIDLPTELHKATSTGFDFICAPIFHPRFERDHFQQKINRMCPLTRSDLLLSSSEWTSLVVGKFSPWIDMDSEVEFTRTNSERAFCEETAFALHLGLPAVLVELKSSPCVNLGRHLNALVQNKSLSMVWVKVPMVPPTCDGEDSSEEDQLSPNVEPWHWWNTVRTMCCGSRKLSVVLEVSAKLPPEASLRRWLGEPVKAAVFHTSVFLSNQKGFPVLSKALQGFFYELLQLKAQFILSGGSKTGKAIEFYWQYLNHLYGASCAPNPIEAFAKGYEDYLQAPLQPLKDNLDSQTYEVFEKDNTKYRLYEEAIFKALSDRVPDDKKESTITTVMVVGAGRGPLVEASIRASQRTGRKIKVYAVEKNPNAFITLKNLQFEKWADSDVTVICSDMREWDAPEKADILISELLGSFGDNELSPECLDGAQRFLKKDAISIPSSYTSYVAPTSSPRLHVDVAQYAEQWKSPDVPYETGYVVYQKNYHRIAEPKPCFTFVHPNPCVPCNNERFAKVVFDITQDCVMHGFSGFFEAVLYKDILMSIVPATHTPDMFSWFSVFFPIKTPIFLPSSSCLELCLWRKVTQSSVWYEWCVTSPVVSPIHNPNGRSYSLGLH